MTSYHGEAYKAPSDQWSWKITQNGVQIAGGAGYETEEDATQAMKDELLIHEKGERENRVQQMVANFRLEGMEPSEADQRLHQEYIAGRVTLDDLCNHAIAYALEHSAHEHSPSNSSRAQEMLAAGHWVTYYDDYLVPDVILREWPDGKMEIIEPDGKGNILVVKELPDKSELRKRRDGFRAALANVKLSGSYPSKEVIDRMEAYATSKLSWDEFFNDSDPGHAA